jgi:hypothetical protein
MTNSVIAENGMSPARKLNTVLFAVGFLLIAPVKAQKL